MVKIDDKANSPEKIVVSKELVLDLGEIALLFPNFNK